MSPPPHVTSSSRRATSKSTSLRDMLAPWRQLRSLEWSHAPLQSWSCLLACFKGKHFNYSYEYVVPPFQDRRTILRVVVLEERCCHLFWAPDCPKDALGRPLQYFCEECCDIQVVGSQALPGGRPGPQPWPDGIVTCGFQEAGGRQVEGFVERLHRRATPPPPPLLPLNNPAQNRDGSGGNLFRVLLQLY